MCIYGGNILPSSRGEALVCLVWRSHEGEREIVIKVTLDEIVDVEGAPGPATHLCRGWVEIWMIPIRFFHIVP